jgi:hypothetical protein
MDPHGPMAYDHFPRLFLAVMIHRGYDGKHKEKIINCMFYLLF